LHLGQPAGRPHHLPARRGGRVLVRRSLAAPWSRYRPYQLLAVALALATTILVLVGLRRLRLDPRRAVLWAWCPTVAVEAGNNAHIDVLGAFLTAAALLVLAGAATREGAGRRGFLAGGVLLGLAIATKLTPGLVLPAVLRRRPVAVLSGVAGSVAAVYLPHVLAVGFGVLGYVPGYLHEEGYTDGQRFALLTMVLPPMWAGVAAAVILAGVGLAVLRWTVPERPWLGATTMVGAALLVAAPSYPWYALLLVVLVAPGGPGGRGGAAAGYLAQYAHELGLAPVPAQRWGYGLAAVAVLTIVGSGHRRAAPRDGA
jgi:hypothetical protein